MKYLRIIFVILATFLGSLAGAQISNAGKIIDVYEKCFVTKIQCSSREITEGEMVLNLWNGNLSYYLYGIFFIMVIIALIESYKSKSNKSLNKDATTVAPIS